MATRGKTTFQKRQKEMVRKDRQQRKAERKEQRKLDRAATDRVPQDDAAPDDTRNEVEGEAKLETGGFSKL